MKQPKRSAWIAAAGGAVGALLLAAPLAQGGNTLKPQKIEISPCPQGVLNSLKVAARYAEGKAVLDYKVLMPDGCSFLVTLEPPERAGKRIRWKVGLGRPPGAACVQVLTPRDGSVEVGPLPPGEYTLEVLSSNGASRELSVEASAPLDRPWIEGIEVEGGMIRARVHVPAGVRRVVLEGRRQWGRGAWSPRASALTDGTEQSVALEVPVSEEMELLRARAEKELPLPASFYMGRSSFNGPVSDGRADAPPAGYWNDALIDAPGAGPEESGQREVQESDLWRIEGDTLYFFNQRRGLQVIDVADPDHPRLEGALSLPASGEQMYVLEGGYVVLLARQGCDWSGSSGSRVLVVDANASPPAVVADLAVEGQLQESRLVGKALYVVSQVYRPVEEPSPDGETGVSRTWTWWSTAVSFDLSDPTRPQQVGQEWFEGYQNVVQATDRFLMVARRAGAHGNLSVVSLLDISDPAGRMEPLSEIHPAGWVKDKFKLSIHGDTLTVISEVSQWRPSRRLFTVLETFSIADPRRPVKVGELELAHDETLFATRFDGDRVYIVTFERVDPLWVVDLRNPAAPRIAGALEVPGWSTYIHPLGDRLVAVGLENTDGWRVAVSLFDVADPSAPRLLDRVPLGENSSWSEATQDEKAFTVLPELGLILLPYQGWSQEGAVQGVQLVDLDLQQGQLALRGVISHDFRPRRATAHGDRILSISGRELLAVDATDRDAPQVTAELELAWPVNRVFAQGDWLLEIQDWGDNAQAAPAIRVAARDAPDEAVAEVSLEQPWPIVGASARNGRLYVLQLDTGQWGPIFWIDAAEDGQAPPEQEPKANGRLTIFDLDSLPELRAAGEAEFLLKDLSWSASMDALWLDDGLLVWAGQGGWGGPIPLFGVPELGMPWRPWWNGWGGRLLAFDVGDPSQPRLASFVDLSQGGERWSFSRAESVGRLVYLTHMESEFVPDETKPDQPGEIPVGKWITRYYLDVVDFADSDSPTVRAPVNVPGSLEGVEGVGAGEALVFTRGFRYDASGLTDGTEWVDALAYDGVKASLAASLPLPAQWPRPVSVMNGKLWLGRPAAEETEEPSLELWRLGDEGKFVREAALALDGAAQEIEPLGPAVAIRLGGAVAICRASLEGSIEILGREAPPGCLWADLRPEGLDWPCALWLPMGEFGVFGVPIAAPAP